MVLTKSEIYVIIKLVRNSILSTKFYKDIKFALSKRSEMNMVIELNRLVCHPMPTPSVDILSHTLPYPIKSINYCA